MSGLPGPSLRFAIATALVAAAAAQACGPSEPPSTAQPATTADVRAYIARTWDTLTRSNAQMAAAAPDPKFPREPGKPWPVYVSAREDRARVEQELREAMTPAAFATIALRVLPPDPLSVEEHGLLYLPRPYVVPGGRFNEMYGWDSYFTLVGLLHDDEVELAAGMVENFLYEVEHYGTILNANRTYYLSRSQPPFLTRMVLELYGRTHDRALLERAMPAIERYYRYWTSPPHLEPTTGLSRYYDLGEGPAPEVVSAERDAAGRTHYDRAREYYRTHDVTAYDESRYYDAAADRLTPLFYKGDRSMRESGFDPSNRFGPLNVDVIHHVPVCLNSLLYRMEVDAGEILNRLERPGEAAAWLQRAQARRDRINDLTWDEEAGLYFDYDFEARARRPYPFATTFYPLWAGIATTAQAARVREALGRLGAPGGLLTSTNVSGSQWDAPFGWGPLQMIAVDGLRRYGFHQDADRLAGRFVALVAKEFGEHGVIVEKYDVCRRESDVAQGLRFGYESNEVGFGWTNAAVLHLLAGLREPVEAGGPASAAPPAPPACVATGT